MNRVRALVLDDSAICRMQLRNTLQAEGDIQVVGEAPNGDRVLSLMKTTRPNVLVVDLQMPGTGGQETIEKVMANQPMPILVVTAQPAGVRKTAVFESIRRGALDLAEKPGAGDRAAEARLRAIVRQLSSVPVVRHVAGKLHQKTERPAPLRPSAIPPAPGPLLIGIGASAGGPFPLATLIAELPREFPAALAVVQHLPLGFVAAFVEHLQSRSKLPLVIVERSQRIQSGTIYVAADDTHLCVSDSRNIGPDRSPHCQGHRPAVDILFHSMAREIGVRAAAVLLSGIGQDGVSGMADLKEQGALTIAQDAASCSVFGMPRAALESGAAQHSLPPLSAAELLHKWAHDTRRRQHA